MYVKFQLSICKADDSRTIKSADFVGRFYRTTKNRPILSAINLAVEHGSNFAEKIGRRPILSFVYCRLNSSRDFNRGPNFMLGIKFPLKLVPQFWVKVHMLFGVERGGSLIARALRRQFT